MICAECPLFKEGCPYSTRLEASILGFKRLGVKVRIVVEECGDLKE